ncbi:MAG: hypothetical protein R6V03_04390, partial [Kiritimatiellia bacterium]
VAGLAYTNTAQPAEPTPTAWQACILVPLKADSGKSSIRFSNPTETEFTTRFAASLAAYWR